MEDRDDIIGTMRQLLGGERPLEVVLDRETHAFRTPQEFAQALAPRVQLPTHVAKLIVQYDGARAWLELEQTRRVLSVFSELVHWSYESGQPAHGAWRELEAVAFADENDWRGILRTLDERRDLDGRYLRAALANYLKYLAERRDLLETVVRRLGEPVPTRPDGARAGVRDAQDITGFTEVRGDPDYQRLPTRDAVALAAGQDQVVNVYLAHRRLQLVATDKGWQLRDGDHLRVILREGRFVVGRASDCDVVLRDAPRDVSRHHLVIECLDADRLRLIDMSSHGTYLPRAALAADEGLAGRPGAAAPEPLTVP